MSWAFLSPTWTTCPSWPMTLRFSCSLLGSSPILELQQISFLKKLDFEPKAASGIISLFAKFQYFRKNKRFGIKQAFLDRKGKSGHNASKCWEWDLKCLILGKRSRAQLIFFIKIRQTSYFNATMTAKGGGPSKNPSRTCHLGKLETEVTKKSLINSSLFPGNNLDFKFARTR